MMGHRGTNCGSEVDALSQRARRYYGNRAGVRRYWKRRFNKRMRRLAKVRV